MKQLDDLKTSPAQGVPGSAAADSASQFARDLVAYPKKNANLAPDDAAQAWIDLFNRALKLQANAGSIGGYTSATPATFSALPGPASWPSLAKKVESQQTNTAQWASLRLIMDTLNNNEDQQWADLTPLVSAQGTQRISYSGETGSPFFTLGTALSEMSNQPGQVEKFWDSALTGMEHGNGENQFELPDLVTILGEAKAKPLLQRALLLPVAQIVDINGLATQTLARKMALDNIDKLSRPPWFLTKTLDGAPLYEALRKKFPNDSGNQAYAIYYLLALVTQDRTEEAAKVDADIDMSQLQGVTEEIANEGWQPQVYDFIHVYLGLHPDSSLWDFYIELAAQTGHSGDALKFIQDTAARTDISATAREGVQSKLYEGLLAVDKVDEGIEQLRALIKSEKVQLTANPAKPANAGGLSGALANISNALAAARSGITTPEDPRQKIMKWDLELAKLGHLLKRDALEKEGLDDAIQIMASKPPPVPNGVAYSNSLDEDSLERYLIETGRYAQAENMVIKELVEEARVSSSDNSGSIQYQGREALLKLALVYYQAGRWSDIITLLKKAPYWGAKDLVDIVAQSSYLEGRSTPSLGLIAARALVETGHVDEALPILNYTLQEDAGSDPAYALFLKIGKGDLVAQLDALYKQDQFQERPLIWKAIVLLQQGKVDEAEAACKAAIAVDPSDGEEGKGDRMRVYSVMADVCDAKKDPKQAEFFRNVVKAIRLSEDADDYYEAGLLTRAVDMYGQALNLFSDAYCIQSRIARQLAELGRTEEAAVHYRKAFELMPVSFGRLESHCFGCERAFKGKTAVDIATKTFTEMMAKDPKKPQIPYLLGYLYMEQDQFPEALANFQKAAELDPDYINAWRHIVEIGEKYQLSPDVRDAAVFNLIRLDPAGRHVTPNTELVRQLAKLWEAEEKASAAINPAPKTLYPLDASAAAYTADDNSGSLAARLTNATGADADNQAWADLQQVGFNLGHTQYNSQGRGVSPLDAVMANKVISCALGFQ